MSALLVAALLSTVPPAGAVGRAFWERDLPTAVARLVEPPIDDLEKAQHAIFADLVRLVSCEPLAPVSEKEPAVALRLLVRAEALRHARLGAQAAASPTVWADILEDGFFTREEPPPPPEGYLYWPVEEERWPVERVQVKLRPSACGGGSGSGDELAVLALPQLAETLARGLTADPGTWAELSTRIAYQRAARRLALGELPAAAEDAKQIDLEQLPSALQPYGALVRLEAGVDAEDGYLALRGQPLDRRAALWVLYRSAALLGQRAQWNEVLLTTHRALEAYQDETDPALLAVVEDLAYRYVSALGAIGQRQKQREAFARFFPDWATSTRPAVEGLRELAIDELATRPLDESALDLVHKLGTPNLFGRRLHLVGSRALTFGFANTSSAAADALSAEALPRTRALGHALFAERAVVLKDRVGLERAVQKLFIERKAPELPNKERDELDKVALELCQALVSRSVALADPRWVKLIRLQLEQIKEAVAARHQKSFEQLFAALEQRPALQLGKGRLREAYVAVGEVNVGLPGTTLPAPKLALSFPEPYSLLAIPTQDGQLRGWFEPAQRAAREDPDAK